MMGAGGHIVGLLMTMEVIVTEFKETIFVDCMGHPFTVPVIINSVNS